MHKNNSLKPSFLLILLPLLLAFLVFISIRLAIQFPFIVEKYYSAGIYPNIAYLFSLLSNTVNFSIWDLLWVLMLLLVIFGLVLVIFKTIRLGWYMLQLVRFMLFFYSFFYISWGFNYFRPGIEARLGWQKCVPDENAFRIVLSSLIDHANMSHTKFSISEYPGINKLIEESYQLRSHKLGISYPSGTRVPKTMLLSSYYAMSGVSGYFGPFFNEVHVNFYQLPIDYPFVLAHEKAHQFGIANESEANLAAFIVCTGSEDPRLQYSGYIYMLMYFLKDAQQLHDYHNFIEKIKKPVLDDITFRERYYDELRNKTLDKLQDSANDVYLKSNNIKKGIKNYNQVVGLIISWYNHSELADN